MCYNFAAGAFNFDDARSECLILGGKGADLASVSSYYEQLSVQCKKYFTSSTKK